MQPTKYYIKQFSLSNKVNVSFDFLFQPFGYVVYETTIHFNPTDPAVLTVKGIADRGYVYVDKVFLFQLFYKYSF